MKEKSNIATHEEMVAEAVQRMKMLGIFEQTIEQFAKNGQISQSEQPFGAYYWIDAKSKLKIAEIEKEYDGLVYSVVRSYTNIGMLDSCLWVSKYKDEWERDRADISFGTVFAYVINWNDEQCSEFGSVVVKIASGGGLVRVS